MSHAPAEIPRSSPVASSPLPALSAPPSALDVPLPGLWRITWPLFISLALSFSLHFTDAFFLSRISDAAAAAAGAINPLLGSTVVLFSAVGQAGASVAGRLVGARRYGELPLTFMALVGFNLLVGLVVSATFFALHPYVPGWLGLEGEAALSAQAYLAVLGGFQVLKAVQLAYGNMINSLGKTRWVLVEAIATNVSNLALNLALSHGAFGLRPSVRLVAAATVLSLLFGMLFTMAVVHGRLGVRFPLRSSLAELRRALSPILRIGLPSAAEPIAYQLAQIAITSLVISISAQALAARTYVISFVTVTSVLWSIALGIGTQILIAHRVGAGRADEANAQLHRALLFAMIGNVVLASLLALFHRPLLGLLTQDPEILRLAAPLFALGILVELGRALNIVAGGALRSVGDARIVMIGVALMWGVGVPAAFLLGGVFGLGLTGVWIAMAADEIVRGVVNYRRWCSGKWRVLAARGESVVVS